MRYIPIGVGLIAGNFIWQSISGQHWDVACDRSVFQAIAFATMWLCDRVCLAGISS